MATPQYTVFISYRHKDHKEFAKELEQFLDLKKKPTFRDETELAPGQDITKECERAIRNSQVFLPILSKHYCEGACDQEFWYNRDEAKKPILPVVMPDAIIPGSYKKGGWPLYVEIPEDYHKNRDLHFNKILKGVEAAQMSATGKIPGKVQPEGSEDEIPGSVPPKKSEGPTLFDKPTINQLQKLKGAGGKEVKIIEYVAAHWTDIAIAMEFDDAGQILTTLRNDYNDAEQRCKAIFIKWREGKGSRQPATWDMLIKILKDCSLNVLADDITQLL